MKTAFRAAGTNTKLVGIKNHHYVYVIINEWMPPFISKYHKLSPYIFFKINDPSHLRCSAALTILKDKNLYSRPAANNDNDRTNELIMTQRTAFWKAYSTTI